MSLKFRLAFLFSLSVFVILVASSISIYFLNENFRREEFYKRLAIEAKQSQSIYTSLSGNRAAKLNENARNSLQGEQIIILDSALRVLYTSPNSRIPIISPLAYNEAKKNKIYSFTEGKREGVISYDSKPPFLVLASAIDIFGRRKSDNLKLLLTASVIGGLLLSGLLAFIYVLQALKPLKQLQEGIENFNEENLTNRVSISGKNEVAKIGKQFNAMLDRLEHAIEQRKSFIQHASHELRTPLANMLAQTEAALGNSLSPEEYKKVLQSLNEDQQYLIDLINSLLTLSRYEKMSAVRDLHPIRIDEVLFQTTDFINQIWPEATITVDFETIPENENLLIFLGNETLIKSAIQNLVKNAIQYSDRQKVRILISLNNSGIRLVFENDGRTLLTEERAKLFIPFFRGENSLYKKGFGLGLSIVETIIKLHHGNIEYEAEGENINRFIVDLPR